MTAFGGLRGTGDWGPDERPKNFRERILWMSPNGSAPITALLSRARKESTDDPEFSWFVEPLNLVRLTVSGTHISIATTITVGSSDPDETDLTRHYGSALNLVPGDILMVETADSSTFQPEYMRVTSVLSATQFTVERGVAGSTPLALSDGTALIKIGSAFPEGTAAPGSASRNPVKQRNYTQIFKTTYEISKTAANTRVRTGDPLKTERKRRAFDHARDMELAFLFGRPYETVDATTGEIIRYTGGIRYFLPATRQTVFGSPPTSREFLDALDPVFQFDTEAGNTRIAFCGSGAYMALPRIFGDSAQIQFTGNISLWKIDFQRVAFPFGEIAFKIHPLMSAHPVWRNSILVLDFSALVYRPLRGRDTTFKDNIQLPDEDKIRGQWLTEAGLEVQYGGLTCAYLGGVTA